MGFEGPPKPKMNTKIEKPEQPKAEKPKREDKVEKPTAEQKSEKTVEKSRSESHDKPTHETLGEVNKKRSEIIASREKRQQMGLAPEAISTPDIETYVEESERNIENIRKDNIILEGLEPNTEYDIELQRHEFPFGAAVDFNMAFGINIREKLLQKYPDRKEEIEKSLGTETFNEEYRKRYLQTLEQVFNKAMPDYDFHWSVMEVEGYEATDKIMDYLRNRPELLEKFSGHRLFYNRKQALPSYLKDKPKEEVQRALFKDRLEILRKYPEIKEWFLNEPLKRDPRVEGGADQNEVIFDPEKDIDVFVELFKRVKEINPEAKMYINEYDILNGKKLEDLAKFVKALLEKGAPVDGIALEAHIWEGAWGFASLEQIKQNLDVLSELGLPIKISEFDVSDEAIEGMYFPPGTREKAKKSGSEKDFDKEVQKMRAEFVRKAFTIFFGHKAVKEISQWGFQDKSHWKGRLGKGHYGLFDENFEPNEVGRAFLDLMRNKWSTKVKLVSDEKGRVQFRGYPGDYRVLGTKTGKEIKARG